MKKLLLCAVLATGIGGASFLDSSANAQATKKTTDAKKTEVGSKPGKIEIKEGKDHKFRFIVHDADGDFLCTSAAFKTEKEAFDGIDDLKAVLANTKPTVVKGTHDQDEKVERKGKTKMEDKK